MTIKFINPNPSEISEKVLKEQIILHLQALIKEKMVNSLPIQHRRTML